MVYGEMRFDYWFKVKEVVKDVLILLFIVLLGFKKGLYVGFLIRDGIISWFLLKKNESLCKSRFYEIIVFIWYYFCLVLLG